ncbi:hypothetical protein GGP62_000856 [Salinibacter ruber]|uniref:hypothetical protein n=1 Tax=Salinibacter ruber TaxID=146919 RepID=UPI0013C348C0|nr:hypothetical protein [Salinibacter ruber]MCS3705881.1 hypothetical protein [Salinibacter ruber]
MRIIFLSYEQEARAMSLLAKKFDKGGDEVLLGQCDYYDFNDTWGVHDFFDSEQFGSWVDSANEHERLFKKDWEVDWSYLKRFEKEYCVTKSIQQLLMTDPIIARHHHFRYPYYTPIDKQSRQYYWLEVILKWCEKVKKEFDPELAVTFGRNYLIKNVFAQFSESSKLNMCTIIRSRVGKTCHVVENFGYGTSKSVKKFVNNEQDGEGFEDARKKVNNFQQSGDEKGLYNAKSYDKIKKKNLYTNTDIVRYVINRTKGFILSAVRNTNSLDFWNQNSFYGQSLLTYAFFLTIAAKRIKYRLSNKFREDIPDRPFIYLPLHTIPESSTLTLTTEYYEGDIIRYVSKELPAKFIVAVKENPNMVGLRPNHFYKKISSIPNVEVLDPGIPSKRLITLSEGVTGISGTALLEASILGRPTHCFGHPEFEKILDYQGHSGFASFVEKAKKQEHPRVNRKVIKYLQYISEHGHELPLRDIQTWKDEGSIRGQIQDMENMIKQFVANNSEIK